MKIQQIVVVLAFTALALGSVTVVNGDALTRDEEQGLIFMNVQKQQMQPYAIINLLNSYTRLWDEFKRRNGDSFESKAKAANEVKYEADRLVPRLTPTESNRLRLKALNTKAQEIVDALNIEFPPCDAQAWIITKDRLEKLDSQVMPIIEELHDKCEFFTEAEAKARIDAHPEAIHGNTSVGLPEGLP